MELRGHVRKFIPPSARKRGRGDTGGYGFIAADGADYYVNIRDVIGNIKVGAPVVFIPQEGPAGKSAVAVKVRVL